ncbi:AAA family ATPase [Acinetobacter lwoffii]|uniref:AAA family ATPase n=1 Tax=Acinetobacter lwoffii TaxID=28090 RepID=UPI003F8D5631
MLRNIEIENFGSYHNFNGLAEKNHFKKMNIIYGANYSGKTTLSRIFAILKNKNDPENYSNPIFKIIFENEILDCNNYKENSKEFLVFNKDFINENLSFLIFNNHENGSIKSFDAVVIGQDQIVIDGKINELLSSADILEATTQVVNLVLNQIKKDRDRISQEIIEITRNKDRSLTEKARDLEAIGLNAARTYQRPNLVQDINKILSANPNLVKKLTEEEIQNKINDMKVSQKPEINIENKEAEIRNYISRHIENCKIKLKEVIELKVTKEINEFFKNWAVAGYHLHKEHDKDYCEFCGGELKKTVLEQYEIFANQKDESFKKEIIELIENQNKIVKALFAVIDGFVEPEAYFYDSFKVEYLVLIESIKSKAFNLSEDLSLLEDMLKEKLQNLTLELEYDFIALEENLNDLIESYTKVVDICNKNDEFTKNIAREQSKLKTEVLEERIIEYLIKFEWYKINNKIKALNESIEKLLPFEQENSERIEAIKTYQFNIQEKIKQLNAQKSTTSAASELVNKFLNSFFGHESLSLIPIEDEGQQGRFKIVRNGREAYNLSEGECTLVAFCYFIALVFNLKNIGKLTDVIIYIDDPISSLDSNNIFYIYSLIENIICKEKAYKQLFISTHNLEFFKYLRKLTIPKNRTNIKSCNDPSCTSTKKNENEDISFYLVNKENNISKLNILPNYLRKYNTEFNYLFSQIWNCAQVTTELSPDQIYNLSNNMRKFFEVYNYFKYPSDLNKAVFREKFFDVENNLNHFKLVDRIANEYSHTEEIFDRTMRPISSQEMITASKFILERLKVNDEVQFNALVQSTKDLRENH